MHTPRALSSGPVSSPSCHRCLSIDRSATRQSPKADRQPRSSPTAQPMTNGHHDTGPSWRPPELASIRCHTRELNASFRTGQDPENRLRHATHSARKSRCHNGYREPDPSDQIRRRAAASVHRSQPDPLQRIGTRGRAPLHNWHPCRRHQRDRCGCALRLNRAQHSPSPDTHRLAG